MLSTFGMSKFYVEETLNCLVCVMGVATPLLGGTILRHTPLMDGTLLRSSSFWAVHT